MSRKKKPTQADLDRKSRRRAERDVRIAALRNGNNGPKAWRAQNGRAEASRSACRGAFA